MDKKDIKILIVNQHTCNRGDEAAGRAVIESLQKAFKGSKINVLYRFHNRYPAIWQDTENVKHFPEIKYKYDKKHIISYYLEIITNILLSILKSKFFIGASGEVCKKILEADIIVNAPTGPNIGNIYKDKYYLMTLIFSVLQGKKTVMYGSSVGPFDNGNFSKWAKFLFNRMDFVCVREDVSLKYLQDMNLKNKNIYSSVDAAIQRDIPNEDADNYFKDTLQKNIKNVGITPLAYQWYPKDIRNIENQKRIEENLVKVLDELTKNGDTNVYFFPQLFHLPDEETEGTTDMPIINSIISQVKKSEYFKVLPNEYDSDIQQKMISKLDYFIGMRYHSIIFSVKMLVPVVAISYEHKAVGFLQKAGLHELNIDIHDFLNNYQTLLDKIKYINDNKDSIIKSIRSNLENLKQLSCKGTTLLENLINGLK